MTQLEGASSSTSPTPGPPKHSRNFPTMATGVLKRSSTKAGAGDSIFKKSKFGGGELPTILKVFLHKMFS